jgi:hypothetical protein
MAFTANQILDVLDRAAEVSDFPMLDNGYIYLAATRLSLFRSPADWALVIEHFGYSPRAYVPSIDVMTFASRRHSQSVDPSNELASIFPLEEGDWIDEEDAECVAVDATEIVVRGSPRALPRLDEYARHGIELEDPERVRIFELCRYLAAVVRDDVLARPHERRVNVPPELAQILVLDEWHHPDLVNDEHPSDSESFQQLAVVLATGDLSRYRPAKANTHWKHWPDGGTL